MYWRANRNLPLQDMMPKISLPAWALACCAAAAAVLAGCDNTDKSKQQAKGPPPAPQVTVATPVKRPVVDYDEYVGRFIAVDSVEVRARLSGYLDQVLFRDGQLVKKGDPLFIIDRRPFQNTLEQVRASLTQARANLAYAEADLSRAQGLVGGSVISQQAFEQRTQAKRVAEANVSSQEAALKQAELDMEFTELKAPVAGRIGDRRVSPGNLVTGGTGGNTTLLANIQTIDPIRFEFTMDETSYLRYSRIAGGPDQAEKGVKVPVNLKLIDEQAFAHEGFIDFVDNAIDRSSGTIRGRAQFPNPKALFTPGMFARIRVAAGPPKDALLVPDAAIGSEQVRKFVYVVDAENTAKPKYVTLGQVVENNLRVVTGLDEGDRVIVNGLMRVRPGSKVTPTTAAAADASPAKK